MLLPTRSMLADAQQRGYAVGGFNIYNLEGVAAVLAAAEAEASPVMLQIHPAALDHGGRGLIALCLQAGDDSPVPVAVHLDHSTQPDAMMMAINAGMHSIMADGSHRDFDANVDFVRQSVDMAHAKHLTVEGELGRISGTEDGLTVAAMEARMTDPDQAADFVAQTGIDALAVCIGNVHGSYPFPPQLDFERLRRIRARVAVPLVLHGASGLPDAMVREAIANGICKFNVNTEVRRAYLGAVRQAQQADPTIDLVALMQTAQAAMREIVAGKLRLFQSSGKADTSRAQHEFDLG